MWAGVVLMAIGLTFVFYVVHTRIWIVPVVVVSNVPARLLVKSFDQPWPLISKLVIASTVIFCLSRAFWSFALRRYSSASS